MIKFLVILFFASLTISCTPDIKPKDANLGKESTSEEYQKAIEGALSGISIADAQIGQYATYEDNLRVELGPVMRYRKTSHKLIAVKEDAREIKFVMFEDKFQYDLESGEITDEKHSELSFPFQKLATPSQFFINSTALAEQCDGRDVKDEKGRLYDCIKYFNLVSKIIKMAPPAAVAAKPNCMGIPNCLMTVNYLKYDIVKWRNGKAIDTINVTAEIAKEVPDLMYEYDNQDGSIINTPPVMSLCFRGNELIDSRYYLITKCTLLRDFQ